MALLPELSAKPFIDVRVQNSFRLQREWPHFACRMGSVTSAALPLFCCLVLCILAGCATKPAAPPEAAASHPARSSLPLVPAVQGEPRDIGDILSPIFVRAKIPGGAAVVLRGNRIVAQGVAGVRRRGAAEVITINDQFEICSCSKSMTATLAALLIEEGKLRWDTTLEELFRDTIPHIDPAWKGVTVRQALAHSAGMRDHLVSFALATTFSHADVSTQRRKFAAKILSRRPDYLPGSESRYNSTDYLIVAVGLEMMTGRTWEELIGERLFQPLELCTAGFGPPGTSGRLDQPWGHGDRWWFHLPCFGPGCTAFDPGNRFADVPAAAAPAGLIHMSVPDWAKFVAVHLRGDAANPNHSVTLLKEESFVKLHQPGPNETYAGGWFTGTRKWAKGPRPGDSGRVLFHQGDNGRWNSVVWVAPEIDFAILIVCNRSSMWGPVDAIAGALVTAFAAGASN